MPKKILKVLKKILRKQFNRQKKNQTDNWSINIEENNNEWTTQNLEEYKENNNREQEVEETNNEYYERWRSDKINESSYTIQEFTVFLSYEQYKENFETKQYNLYLTSKYIFSFLEAHAISYAKLHDNSKAYNNNKDMNS